MSVFKQVRLEPIEERIVVRQVKEVAEIDGDRTLRVSSN